MVLHRPNMPASKIQNLATMKIPKPTLFTAATLLLTQSDPSTTYGSLAHHIIILFYSIIINHHAAAQKSQKGNDITD